MNKAAEVELGFTELGPKEPDAAGTKYMVNVLKTMRVSKDSFLSTLYFQEVK